MSEVPAGYVDPRDVAQVTQVVVSVLEGAGLPGVLDLLARVPGVRVDPGSPKGFLRAAVPASTWVGPEHQLVLVHDGAGERLLHQHVVGGVTLARDGVPHDQVAGLVARLLTASVTATGGAQEASAALTAHRELFGPA